jgi:hypothetical protein
MAVVQTMIVPGIKLPYSTKDLLQRSKIMSAWLQKALFYLVSAALLRSTILK